MNFLLESLYALLTLNWGTLHKWTLEEDGYYLYNDFYEVSVYQSEGAIWYTLSELVVDNNTGIVDDFVKLETKNINEVVEYINEYY